MGKTFWNEYLRLEEAWLAPWAVSSARSRGRAYPEREDPLRTPFQRDRERIIHTAAFRRLVHKTQVFVAGEGDYYRTRLTHTLEVAEVALTIARALRLNGDLAEAISYAHDLGHPPFGHAGEAALSRLMRDHGGFEHNAQALRIVTKLEERFAGFRGLNLSWEVLEGIAKHSARPNEIAASPYEPGRQATLEAQVCSIADEIAYNSHDLDDGIRSGRIDFDQLETVTLWREASQQSAKLGAANNPTIDRHQTIRFVIHAQMLDLVKATMERIDQVALQSVDDARDQSEPIVGYSSDMAEKDAELKQFLQQHLYQHVDVLEMQRRAQHVIGELFEAYTAKPELLPGPVRASAQDDQIERVVCDYIAGMTDRFAIDEHRRLFDPPLHS